MWDLSVLPALYLSTSPSEPSATPGPLDLSSPSSLSSNASSSGEEDEGRTSDPPSPEPTHTYAPRQRMKCTGSKAHAIPREEEEEEREAPVTAARPAFLCKHCPKEYTSLGALKMHIRSHTLPCVCTTCGKAFSRPWLLRGHIRTHTGKLHFTSERFLNHETTLTHPSSASQQSTDELYVIKKSLPSMALLKTANLCISVAVIVSQQVTPSVITKVGVGALDIHFSQFDELNTEAVDVIT